MTDPNPRTTPPDPIDPAWWASTIPSSTTVNTVEGDEIDPLGPPGWQSPEIISAEIAEVAKAAPDGSTQKKVLSALADASSAMLEPEDFAEPFRPAAAWADGRRSVLPSDIDADRIELLASAALLIDNVPMRARAADVAWTYGNKADMQLLRTALDAYFATPLERWAWHNISRDSWRRGLEIIQRRGNAEAARRDAAADEILRRMLNGTVGDGFMLVDLADMYRRVGGGDAQTRRKLAEKFVALASAATAPRFCRHLERTARRFWIILGEDDLAYAATERIAALYETEADQRLASDDSSSMAAGMDIEKAIATLAELPRKYRRASGIDARIEDLRRRLVDTREATLDAMAPIETDPIDISTSVSEAERAVSGQSRFDALARLASIAPLTDEERALADAKESLEGTIARLFGRNTFAADGRKVASSTGASGEPDEAEIWSSVVRYFDLRVGVMVQSRIVPALDVVTIEHRYDMTFLRRLCWDSPTVPPDHVDLWARGIWHGLNGDFPSAVSVLVPQAEQLLRHHLKQAGVHTLFVDPATGVETEKGLGSLLVTDEARDFLGPNLQLELRALLVEQEGPNLRNELAHGLLSDGGAWSANAAYAWWLLMRMVVIPLRVMLADARETSDAETR